MLSKKVRKSLKEREPMSERTISARFKCQNTTIIQVYTPTRGGSERRLKPSASYCLQQKKDETPYRDYRLRYCKGGLRQ